ncbi:hypothetical protein MTP09_11930 [Chryseobacterium suipulveris]|uniref:Four helix bundle protein n=1 Tax=Chryseobacterium suipulveris TaxID=2929800 RepID=A0ABY4BS93_9FLAO|nr:hypothetical protein [Chryseobacterium suipulveris]UOE40601.1 hypothetical protein MTP09_11930 [Chryseobacterium suipulveris]
MRKKLKEMPLYKKADEIYRTVKTICDLIPDENEYLQHTKMHLQENTMVIMAKISGAEAVNLWDIKMENAAIIRKCARELMVSYHSLTAFGFDEADYYLIVRKQLEEFRMLFREWVASFDPKKFIVDEWGLFNPPGIPQDYQQSDEEIDFLDDDEDELDFGYDDFDDEDE